MVTITITTKTWKSKRSITNGKEIIYEGLSYKTVRKYNNN